jgi:hypothetical protein
MDHWVSGDRHPAAKRLKWVVPRQQMGVTHLKFAAELYSRGNLLIWPENTSELSFDGGRVWKLPRHGNRNYSGIVMLVDTHSGGAEASVLITGDAPYNRVPEGTMGGLHGLVVTHHGGTFRGDRPPVHDGNGQVVYSFGEGNTYGHPTLITVDKHMSAGWHERRDTPGGHASLPRLQNLPFSPTGCCDGCNLEIQQ